MGRGKAASGFGADRVRTVVSIATDTSHRVIMGKTVSPLFFSFIFHPILFILAGNNGMHEISDEFEIQPDPITDCGVNCP